MSYRKHKHDFKTEHDLCKHMIAHFAKDGILAYPETYSWDILFVHPDGRQFGIQAKLHPNVKVIAQAIDDHDCWTRVSPIQLCRPDYIGVLVPFTTYEFDIVAMRCDISIFEPSRYNLYNARYLWDYRHLQESEVRVDLPGFVPDLPAGVPSPRQMSAWKVKALRLGSLLDSQGFLLRKNFLDEGISPTLWLEKWLDRVPGERGKYVRRLNTVLPHDKHSAQDITNAQTSK